LYIKLTKLPRIEKPLEELTADAFVEKSRNPENATTTRNLVGRTFR